MRGLCVRGALAEVLCGLPALEQAPLRGGQAFVGGGLLRLKAADRLPRLVLTANERLPLLFSLMALASQLLALQCEARLLIGRVLEPRLQANDRLLLLVLLRLEGGN